MISALTSRMKLSKLRRIFGIIFLLKRLILIIRHFPKETSSYLRSFRQEKSWKLTKFANSYSRLSSINAEKIFYFSFNGRELSGNPYAIFRHFIDSPDFATFIHVIAVHDLSNPKLDPYRDHPRVKLVQPDTVQFVRHHLSSKFVILDSSTKDYIVKVPGQIWVHSWHSTLLKGLARDAGRPWEAQRVGRSLLMTDIFLSPNRFTTERLLESHGVDQFFDGTIAEFGYPRIDLILNADRDAIRRRLGVAEEERLIAYVPTWRGQYSPTDTSSDVLYTLDKINRDSSPETKVIGKFHSMMFPFIRDVESPFLAPSDLDIQELLAASDAIITDYSGVFFDFLTTDRPIFYYVPDREEYLAQNGLYLDLDHMPGPVFEDLQTLIEHLRRGEGVEARYRETYLNFKERFVGEDDGKATDRAVELIFNGRKDPRVYRRSPQKRTVVMNASTFAKNGVISAFISLTENFDYENNRLLVLLSPRDAQKRRHTEIDPRANFVYYIPLNRGQRLRASIQLYLLKTLGASRKSHLPVSDWELLAKRTVGHRSFDVAIDFSGYNPAMAGLVALGIESEKKICFLHNDLRSDMRIKHPQLIGQFSLYPYFDELVCVSASSLETNRRRIGSLLLTRLGVNLQTNWNLCPNQVDIARKTVANQSEVHVLEIAGNSLWVVEDGGNYKFAQVNPGDTVFIAIGRLSPEKNHKRLLTAFATHRRSFPNSRLILVGEGVKRLALQKQIQQLGEGNNIFMFGNVANPLGLLRVSDCLISASDIEGQPLALLEAMSLGKPIIATDIDGHRDLIPGSPGLAEKSVTGLVQAMADFADRPDEFVISFDVQEYNSDAVKTFLRLLENPGQKTDSK